MDANQQAVEAKKVVLIAGPTASGKSKLALDLAVTFGGTVINADSMQVYRDLRVLTARPSLEDEAQAPHRLYGFVAATDAYSVARFASDAANAIADAHARRSLPIIVGGTGLYFKALLEGLSPVPLIDPEVRDWWRTEARSRRPQDLHSELERVDPVMAARLRPSDPQRIVRALEVLSSTGQSLAHWHAHPGVPVMAAETAVKVVLDPPRENLRQRCEARFQAMLAGGAIEEVAALLKVTSDSSLPIMRALGVRPLMQLVQGDIPISAARDAAIAETWQFVRRQKTWLRRNMITWNTTKATEYTKKYGAVESIVRSALTG